jgi:hypothetical protein
MAKDFYQYSSFNLDTGKLKTSCHHLQYAVIRIIRGILMIVKRIQLRDDIQTISIRSLAT